MTTKAPTRRRLTRYLAGSALAMGLAIESAAVANAVWDIEGFDQCMTHQPDKGREESVEWEQLCCVNSGGVWKSDKGGVSLRDSSRRDETQCPATRLPTSCNRRRYRARPTALARHQEGSLDRVAKTELRRQQTIRPPTPTNDHYQ